MAEINIQRKEQSIWPWIVGGLILLLVILFLAGVFNDDNDMNDQRAATDTTMQNNPAPVASEAGLPNEVQSYLTYVREHDTSNMELDHEYSSTALKHLAAALNVLVDRDYMGDADIDATRKTLQEKAAKLQNNPDSKDHANMLRDAAVSATNLMERMQKAQYPDLTTSVAEARMAATSIKPDVLTLQQKETVQSFFLKAGAVLEAMGRRKA